MNINFISIVLGCAGLLVGGVGLVARDIPGLNGQLADADAQQSVYVAAAWPPHSLAAGVEFHGEMVQLLNLGPQPPRRRIAEPQQSTPKSTPNSEMMVRQIRTVRLPGSRHPQFIEIEFVDDRGGSHVQRYPTEQYAAVVGDRPGEFEGDRTALQSYGYSPRRGRRGGRGHYRGWR